MKQKKELAVLVALLLIAGNIWYWFFFHESSSASPVVIAGGIPVYKPLPVENPAPVTDLLDRARKTEYSSNGRNPFSRELPRPPAPPVPVAPKPGEPNYVPPAPIVPPPPPPLTLPVKYFGYGTVPNGSSRRAFFTDGEDVFIVSEGELLMNRFRILKIGNSKLEFEEISSGRHGDVPLEEETPAASPLAASTQ